MTTVSQSGPQCPDPVQNPGNISVVAQKGSLAESTKLHQLVFTNNFDELKKALSEPGGTALLEVKDSHGRNVTSP